MAVIVASCVATQSSLADPFADRCAKGKPGRLLAAGLQSGKDFATA
jgi:hypothetical protein